MTSRVIEYETDLTALVRYVSQLARPFTVTVEQGRNRSREQNNLMWKWNTEISQQLGDRTPTEVHAYCKLEIGVPILRETNEAFREQYDRIVRPLSYEEKIALMSPPIDLPITSIMGVRQMSSYLDRVQQRFGGQGVILTVPESA